MQREQARDEIKRRIPCTDYLQPAPDFKQKGNGDATGYCCPVCGSGTHGRGSTGAVKYYADTNNWYCHACDRGGDVIDAYQHRNGCDHNRALNELAAQIGITIDNKTTAAQEFSDDATERPQSDENAQKDKYPAGDEKGAHSADFTAYYEICRDRITDPAAISYLQARGIDLETAKACGLGYDPAADPATEPGAMGDEFKAHPTPRIIAPCTKDFYIARSIDPSTPKQYKAPNPKDSHTQLFNAAALFSPNAVFVTEGIFDALSLITKGEAAVATNGKGNGNLLLQQLQNSPAQAAFIICPDNDDDPTTAAQTTQQAEELNNDLRAMGYTSIIYNVAGEHHDTNDALRADPAALEQNIAAAKAALQKELDRDDITDFLEKIQTTAYKGKATGLRFFDDLLGGGILSQSLLLLLAAPGVGKTTLIMQLAEALAERGEPVVFFNLEMSREQMLAKAISNKLHRNGYNKTAKEVLQGYRWTDADRERVTAAAQDYRQSIYPYLQYNPGTGSDGEKIGSNLEKILQYIREKGDAAKAKGEPAPAVVIDYLHKLTSSEHTDVAETIKHAVDGLKQYAIDYDSFCITIGAVNRDSMIKGKVHIHSGRDSSGIEYEGDYILTMNYKAIDAGKVKITDTAACDDLKKAPRREMILRLEKGRLDQQADTQTIFFDAAHNTFYGSEQIDFIPDDNAPAWDDDSQVIMTI